ncbi:hypothetical protein MPLSOD_110109 [Mesorhizobium sp. SOD10]|nr:hypothetical protein MPLSOD_110109 [Mesorhizobium sp. SOD10]
MNWTAWQRQTMGNWQVLALWPDAKPLHHLKRNATDFMVDGEIVGQVRWGVLEDWWRAKRRPAGWTRPEPDYDRLIAEGKAWIAARRAERARQRATGIGPVQDSGGA